MCKHKRRSKNITCLRVHLLLLLLLLLLLFLVLLLLLLLLFLVVLLLLLALLLQEGSRESKRVTPAYTIQRHRGCPCMAGRALPDWVRSPACIHHLERSKAQRQHDEPHHENLHTSPLSRSQTLVAFSYATRPQVDLLQARMEKLAHVRSFGARKGTTTARRAAPRKSPY